MPVIGITVNYHLMFQNSSLQLWLNLLDYLGDNRVRRDVRASVSFCLYSLVVSLGTQAGGSGIKNPPASAGDAGLIPGSGRFSGGGNANLL